MHCSANHANLGFCTKPHAVQCCYSQYGNIVRHFQCNNFLFFVLERMPLRVTWSDCHTLPKFTLSQTLWDLPETRDTTEAGRKLAPKSAAVKPCSEGRSSLAKFQAGTAVWNRYSFQKAFQNKPCSFLSSSIFRLLCCSCSKTNDSDKNRCEANCNTNSIPSTPLIHTQSECGVLCKSFFCSPPLPLPKKGYLHSSRKHKENTVRSRFTRTHLLSDTDTAAVIFPMPCSDTEAAQLAVRGGNQLHGHSCVSSQLAALHTQNKRCSTTGFPVLCLTEKIGGKTSPFLSLCSFMLQNERHTLHSSFKTLALDRLWLCSTAALVLQKRLTALLC